MCNKMTGNTPNLDFVNIIAYIKVGEILSIWSQEIQRTRNSDKNQGPQLCYKCVKNDV